MAKMVKFALPKGAILDGMIHLGDGVFAGYALPAADPVEKRSRVGRHLDHVRTVIFGLEEPGASVVLGDLAEGGCRYVKGELCDLPFDPGEPVMVRAALLAWPDGMSEAEFAESLGVSLDELHRRLDAGLGRQ